MSEEDEFKLPAADAAYEQADPEDPRVSGVSVMAPPAPQAGIAGVVNAAQAQSAVAVEKKTVLETDIETEAQRQAKLEELKRQKMEHVRKAEEVERKTADGDGETASYWQGAIKKAVQAYDDRIEQAKGFQKFIYGVLRRAGVDLYAGEVKKILRGAQSFADTLKRDVDDLKKELNRSVGRKGIAVLLKEKRAEATAHAQVMDDLERMIELSTQTLVYKKKELQETEQKQEQNPTADYSDEMDFHKVDIKKIQKEREGYRADLAQETNRVDLLDRVVTAYATRVDAMNAVATKGERAHTDLKSVIETVKIYIQNGRENEGLCQLANRIGVAVDMIGKLGGMETELGNGLVNETDLINAKMQDAQTVDRGYLTRLRVNTNDDEQKLRARRSELKAKYLGNYD